MGINKGNSGHKNRGNNGSNSYMNIDNRINKNINKNKRRNIIYVCVTVKGPMYVMVRY